MLHDAYMHAMVLERSGDLLKARNLLIPVAGAGNCGTRAIDNTGEVH